MNDRSLLPSSPYRFWVLFVCGVIGAAAFFAVYGSLPLDVTNDHWILSGYVERDIIQHYAGWMAFRQSPWSWPLGLIPGFGGTAVTFTDSIPWLSILFKAISPLLPETFQFFGPYILLNMVLQGVAAGLILSLFDRRPWMIWGGTLLLVLSPVMLERAFRHTALSSHWLILFSIWLLLRARRTGKLGLGFGLLSLLTIGIHPYILPMVYALFAVTIVELWLRRHSSWKRSLLLFTSSAALTLLAGFAIGAFSGGSAGAVGFGYYSMNLNAFFNPLSCGKLVWSQVMPVLPQTLGNYDGFNYPGLGILCFLLPALLFVLVRERGQFKNNAVLILACLCLTLFALSNVITLHDQVVFEYPLPQRLLELASIFRASSRMFYPVYYLIFVAVLWCLSRCGRAREVLLILLLVIQLWDLSPVLTQKREFFREEAVEERYAAQTLYHADHWLDIGNHFTTIKLLADEPYHFELAAYGAKHGSPMDMTMSARCAADLDAIYAGHLEELYQGDVDDRTVYLTCNDELVAALAAELPAHIQIYDIGMYTAITSQKDAIRGTLVPRLEPPLP